MSFKTRFLLFSCSLLMLMYSCKISSKDQYLGNNIYLSEYDEVDRRILYKKKEGAINGIEIVPLTVTELAFNKNWILARSKRNQTYGESKFWIIKNQYDQSPSEETVMRNVLGPLNQEAFEFELKENNIVMNLQVLETSVSDNRCFSSKDGDLKQWAFDNLFDKAAIRDSQIFADAQANFPAIVVDSIKEFEFIQIKYHPYFTSGSRIDCYLMKNNKVVDKVQVEGDRHGVGHFEIVESEDGLPPELIHSIEHKLPMVKVVEIHSTSYEADLARALIRKGEEWISKSIDCQGKEVGVVVRKIRIVERDSFYYKTIATDYDCDNFPI